MMVLIQGILLSAMLFFVVAHGGEGWGYYRAGGRITLLIILAQIIVSGCVWLYSLLNLFNKDDVNRHQTFRLALVHAVISILLLYLFSYQVFSSVRNDFISGTINFLVFLWIALLPTRLAIRKLIPKS
jgi:hypothetical protein